MLADVDVAVIGAGIVGTASALNCLQRTRTVALIDEGDPEEAASYGNAGVISRGSILPNSSPSVRRQMPWLALNRDPAVRVDWKVAWELRRYAAAFWRAGTQAQVEACARAMNPLCAAAFEEHARVARMLRLSHLIERKGWLKLYRTEGQFRDAEADMRLLESHGVEMETFDPAGLKALEPALKMSYARAVLFPETGSIRDPGALVAGWREGVRERGGRLVAASVLALEPQEDGVMLHLSTGQRLFAGNVVIAAGIASNDLLKGLGFDLPLAAERGYHCHFARPLTHSLTRPVYDVARSVIISPMERGLRVLSAVELSLRGRPRHHAQIVLAQNEAHRILELGEKLDARPWMGCRPCLPDSMPAIGALPGLPRVICAFGHGHMGMTLGPVTGLAVSELVSGLEPSMPLAPLSPARFL